MNERYLADIPPGGDVKEAAGYTGGTRISFIITLVRCLGTLVYIN